MFLLGNAVVLVVALLLFAVPGTLAAQLENLKWDAVPLNKLQDVEYLREFGESGFRKAGVKLDRQQVNRDAAAIRAGLTQITRDFERRGFNDQDISRVIQLGWVDLRSRNRGKKLDTRDFRSALSQWCKVTVSSSPDNASVKVEGNAWGNTKLEKFTKEGEYKFEVSKSGYKTKTKTKKVVKDEDKNRFTFTLDKR